MENTAKKATKKATVKTPNSLNKITATAKTINAEVKETATDIIKEVVAEGKAVTAIAKKSAKEVTANINVKENVAKIKATAKTINVEVTEAANSIVNEMVENGKAVKEIATKSAKEVAEKIHVKENVAKIAATAKKVNGQIKETATEILDEVKANGKEWAANTNKIAIETIENANITERVATLKKTVKNANDFTFTTAEDLVEGFAVNGEKWQGLANKAVKNGLIIAGRQQDMMFSTLETVKGQLMNSAFRLKNIFKNN